MKKICKYCSKEFNTHKWYQNFCNRQCYAKWLIDHPINKKLDIIRNCETCGKEIKLTYKNKHWSNERYCSEECRNIGMRKNYEKNCLKNHGVLSTSTLKEVKEKTLKTKLEKYGTISPSVDKIKQTWKSKSDKDIANIVQKRHDTNLKRYGVNNTSKLKYYIDKGFNTRYKNHSLNTSKPEEKIFELLKKKFKNVKRQYDSDLYPFHCDFYIPKEKLYIEYQGNWTHGLKPFENTETDIEKLNNWKLKNTDYYKSAIKVWTITDPLKRQTAKNNNLNWIEFFNFEEFIDWYNKI